jgi:hypothetical protein
MLHDLREIGSEQAAALERDEVPATPDIFLRNT